MGDVELSGWGWVALALLLLVLPLPWIAAALLAGAAVSFAGLLSFVGLLAPHIARRLVGNNHRILLPAAMLLGAAFVVLCDVLARCLFAPFASFFSSFLFLAAPR